MGGGGGVRRLEVTGGRATSLPVVVFYLTLI